MKNSGIAKEFSSSLEERIDGNPEHQAPKVVAKQSI